MKMLLLHNCERFGVDAKARTICFMLTETTLKFREDHDELLCHALTCMTHVLHTKLIKITAIPRHIVHDCKPLKMEKTP